MEEKGITVEKVKTVSNSVRNVGVGAVLVTACIWYMRRWNTQNLQRKSIENSFNAGTADNFASRLNVSINTHFWNKWGDGYEPILSIIEAIPTQLMYTAVEKSYFNQFGKTLNTVLQNELSSSDFKKAQALYNGKKKGQKPR